MDLTPIRTYALTAGALHHEQQLLLLRLAARTTPHPDQPPCELIAPNRHANRSLQRLRLSDIVADTFGVAPEQTIARVAALIAIGPPPEHLDPAFILPTCGTPGCVHGPHLQWVTKADAHSYHRTHQQRVESGS